MMIKSILIANRGEIACRIIKTCKKLGIQSIAVYSDADANALHVQLADKAYYIGASDVRSSYLNQEKILEAAKNTNADAIHPGYGFLSENAEFARKLKLHNLIFIGPNPEAIEWMGSKSKAKEIASQHNVPLVPGYRGNDQSIQKFVNSAIEIGYPVLLKAAAGGGGKGMRIVEQQSELESAYHSAKREALNAFGDDELLLEKYFPSSRHIEIQIFGDQFGNAIYLLERECSIQRRYQKIFEESPSPVLDEITRKEMGEAAVRLAKALHYDNAGTIEFIWCDGKFYFLEVNTRLQVEHPVTEMITGLDLVEMQIESASGLPLKILQEEVKANGYALECRLYAEDVANQFLPVTGTVLGWSLPQTESVRFDTGIQEGSEISVFYDPMISKIIAHGSNRKQAIQRMEYALRNLVCLGTVTNQSFLLNTIQHPDFIAGNYDTHFLQNNGASLVVDEISESVIGKSLLAAFIFHWSENEKKRSSLHKLPSGWRNNIAQWNRLCFTYCEKDYNLEWILSSGSLLVKLSNEVFTLKLISLYQAHLILQINEERMRFNIIKNKGKLFVQQWDAPQIVFTLKDKLPQKPKEEVKGGYSSPMPATVVKVLVACGQTVSNGQSLMILSSMKMENTISASEDGIVEDIFVAESENIEAGKLLLKLEPIK